MVVIVMVMFLLFLLLDIGISASHFMFVGCFLALQTTDFWVGHILVGVAKP